MRALKVLVVVMGVMIVVGVAVVAVTIVRRVSGTVGAPPPVAASAQRLVDPGPVTPYVPTGKEPKPAKALTH